MGANQAGSPTQMLRSPGAVGSATGIPGVAPITVPQPRTPFGLWGEGNPMAPVNNSKVAMGNFAMGANKLDKFGSNGGFGGRF
jgi:hypothetical protein